MIRALLTMALALACGSVAAMEVPPAPPIAAKAFILVDHQSGKVLAQQAENERLDPASITKLMTAYAIFRSIKDGRIGLEDPVTISETAWRTGGSRSFIDVGAQVPLSVLLQGMIIQSGNDASVALAEHVSGSEAAFAVLMNQYARELGLRNTSYRNGTGLSEPEHYTSAADIALLANAIIREFPEYYRWYSQKEFTWNGITQPNRNGLLFRDPSVDGMKTGFTENAGYCLVSSAMRDQMRLVSVVLGTESAVARERESQALLNYGFRFYETRLLVPAGKAISEARVWKGETETADIGINRDLWLTLPRGAADRLQQRFELPSPLLAPLDPAIALGTLKVSLAEQVVAESPLYALSPVPAGSFVQQAWDSMMLWFE
jgi:D-alanyl-D-alanine carboxypeptidase (penicillin-binding protein 5/6)